MSEIPGPASVPTTSGPGTAPRRRAVLGGAALLTAAATVPFAGARPAEASRVRGDLFALGVASGDPLPHAVVLWTRLVRDPFDATSMPDRDVLAARAGMPPVAVRPQRHRNAAGQPGRPGATGQRAGGARWTTAG